MKQFYTLTLIFLGSFIATSQVVINELDVDTPGIDDQEFIELLTEFPETTLDGYVLVFFNGSNSGNDSSYFALDLDGLVSDVNGIILIGSNNVSPVPDLILFDNTVQNGADAVAIYQGTPDDFPDGTQATTTNLIDALVYDTNDSDDTGLLALLGETIQVNEGGNGPSAENSIQRTNEEGYNISTPTPGQLNDGSGVVFNLIAFTTDQTTYEEGDAILLNFSTTQPMTEEVSFNFLLANGTFSSDDYTGMTSIAFAAGTDTASTTVQLIDDSLDEGDEVLKVSFGTMPEGFKRANDNLEVRIIDNDFTTASWGTPLNPTYDQVESMESEDYYTSIDGLAGEDLSQAIQDIIANPEVVRWQTYADIIDILKAADQSPLNSNQVWLVYTEQQRPKLDFQTAGGNNTGLWNREHTYPRSRGGFNDIEDDKFADGLAVFGITTADSLRHANSDAHGLRAADGPENSSRSNQDYGEYTGPVGNQGSFYGDVARSIFFLTLRYNGLDVVSGNPSNTTVGQLGDLDLLLEWHRNDPPDDFEMNRNNIIYEWQRNRNPFIDMPDLAEYIWGSNAGDTWNNPLSIAQNELDSVVLYPNPSSIKFTIHSKASGKLKIYDIAGRVVYTQGFQNNTEVHHSLSAGVYIIELTSKSFRTIKRLVVE